MKLISMTEFVLGTETEWENQSQLSQQAERSKRYRKILSYAKFLKQPLKLKMFVPCDKDGDVLENPDEKAYTIEESNKYKKDLFAYLEAKEKVLFEGFEVNELGAVASETPKGRLAVSNIRNKGIMPNWNIDFLVNYDLTLTPSAIKQLGI